jgi:hypothetical protein
MARVTKFLVDESSQEETADGITQTDVYLVTGVTGSESSRADNARRAGGVPRRGDRHPTVSGLFVDSVSVRPIDTSQFKIFVSYRPEGDEEDPDTGSIEQWTILGEEETTGDADGNLLLTAYTYPSDDENGRGGKIEVQTGVVTIPRAGSGLRFTRREVNPDLTWGLRYGGKVNLYPWNGFIARAVLCLGRRIRSVAFTDEGVEFEVAYEFVIADHRKFITFKDPEKNAIPPDLRSGTGYAYKNVIPAVDFSPMQLTFRR